MKVMSVEEQNKDERRETERQKEGGKGKILQMARQESQICLPLGAVLYSVSGGGGEDGDHHFFHDFSIVLYSSHWNLLKFTIGWSCFWHWLQCADQCCTLIGS